MQNKETTAGIIKIAYQVNDHGECLTPCPFGVEALSSIINRYFKECGFCMLDETDEAVYMVGSRGCAYCKYSHGTTKKRIKLCGYNENHNH